MNHCETTIPKIIIIIIVISTIFLISYNFCSTKREYYGTTITDADGNETTDYDPDNVYTSDTSDNLMGINYLDDNMYYSSNNTVSYVTGAYVPTYEDSVYLTRSSLVSNAKPMYESNEALSGFCSYANYDTSQKEIICNALEKEVCASAQCCVLLGGAKCVTGDEHGPTMKENYNDPKIAVKDYYFYDGKCFGNCI